MITTESDQILSSNFSSTYIDQKTALSHFFL